MADITITETDQRRSTAQRIEPVKSFGHRPAFRCANTTTNATAPCQDIGQGSCAVILGEFRPGTNKSAHFTLAKDGPIAQHVSIPASTAATADLRSAATSLRAH